MDHVLPQTRVGAYVVCVRDGALLLSRFARGGRWTLPGGGLDHGEHPEDAAVREVEEETGYRIVLGKLIGVDSTHWARTHDGSPLDMHALRILYTGEVVGGTLRYEIGAAPTVPNGCRWRRWPTVTVRAWWVSGSRRRAWTDRAADPDRRQSHVTAPPRALRCVPR